MACSSGSNNRTCADGYTINNFTVCNNNVTINNTGTPVARAQLVIMLAVLMQMLSAVVISFIAVQRVRLVMLEGVRVIRYDNHIFF